MSVLGYGMRAREATVGGREFRASDRDDTDTPLKTFIDVLAALIPAELIAAHGAILGFGTTQTQDTAGNAVSTIASPEALRIFFWVLLAAGPVLFLIGRGLSDFGPVDVVRLLIPAAAFVGWVMLQRPSMWDAVRPDTPDVWRYGIPIAGAIILGAIAARVTRPAPGSA